MNYQETCDYLYNMLPMFERQGASGYKEGLDNTLALDSHLGQPHHAYATVHVAGTNGKGSVSHTIASVLQECGYKVGLYTSPHLADFRERIRVNGVPVSERYVMEFVKRERPFFEPLHPTFFEVTTAMALQYFKERKVDIAVIEVGLGGRLDCTNIITPQVSVITNISMDHTQLLGDTLEKIAAEKAGIIKAGVPVVIGESHPETRPVFEEQARKMGAPIVFADDVLEVMRTDVLPEGGLVHHTRHFGSLTGDLGGIYQQQNLNTVFYALQALAQRGFLSTCPDEASREKGQCELEQGIGRVAKNTGLMGRWQTVQEAPRVVCDTGHNVAGWQYISRQLKGIECQRLHIVFGMVDDKDVDGVLQLLPREATYYFTQADSHRAVSAPVLMTLARRYGLEGTSYPSVYEAYKAVMSCADKADFVFVGGSSYVVGDFLKKCL